MRSVCVRERAPPLSRPSGVISCHVNPSGAPCCTRSDLWVLQASVRMLFEMVASAKKTHIVINTDIDQYGKMYPDHIFPTLPWISEAALCYS